jgi:hypothetical protein
MIYSIMGFEPRDGQEYMLATMIVGHYLYLLILNAMHDVFQGQVDSTRARTKSGIVSLDRAWMVFSRDMRTARSRPLARAAEGAPREAEAASAPGPVEIAAWVADWSGMPPAAPGAAPRDMDVTVGAGPVAARPVAPPEKTTAPVKIAPMTPAPVTAARAATALAAARPPATSPTPATCPSTEASRTARGPAELVPRPIVPGVGAAVNRPALMSSAAHLPPNDVDAETLRHIADFESALAALTETLEEARALDGVKTGAKASSGD